jgi:hypothetical protein
MPWGGGHDQRLLQWVAAWAVAWRHARPSTTARVGRRRGRRGASDAPATRGARRQGRNGGAVQGGPTAHGPAAWTTRDVGATNALWSAQCQTVST